MQSIRRFLVVGLVLATGLLTGCERVSSGDAGGTAHQRVTTGFGATSIVDAPAPDGRTVLDALRAVAPVETAYGGGFVSAIGDVRSDLAGRRDWFFYVNGISASQGADRITLRSGDRVWWDHRPWAGIEDAWAVVGDWPEPFLHGPGREAPQVAADPPLAAALVAAGATVVPGDSPWRVRVGADADLRRRDPAWRSGDGSGATARIRSGAVEVLATDGRTWAAVPGARAIAVAVPTADAPDEGVLLAVAGLDASAARAAAASIAADPSVLSGAFAVAFDAAGNPVARGGQVPR